MRCISEINKANGKKIVATCAHNWTHTREISMGMSRHTYTVDIHGSSFTQMIRHNYEFQADILSADIPMESVKYFAQKRFTRIYCASTMYVRRKYRSIRMNAILKTEYFLQYKSNTRKIR